MQDDLRAMGHDGITHIGGQYVRRTAKSTASGSHSIPSRSNPSTTMASSTEQSRDTLLAQHIRRWLVLRRYSHAGTLKVDDLFQNRGPDAKTLDGAIGDIVFGFEKIPNVPISGSWSAPAGP